MDNWVLVDNSGNELEFLAEGDFDEEKINNEEKWNGINENIMQTKEQLKEERDKIVKGLEETYRRLFISKKQKNSPMIIMRNGKIEAVDPN